MVRCPTENDLERLVHGDLSGAEATDLQRHAETCSTCRRWLEEAAADDELEVALVHALGSGGERSPGSPMQAPVGDALPVDPPPGLARYRILRKLGAGGMGVVWEAEQKSPRRRVALKILRPGLVSPRAVSRFAHEVETLARLDHPGIARILEADTFETHGERQPFFAMELVEGVTIDRFAEPLDQRARLELFALVCDAVAHAHARGVLHRDIKPSNVLVTHDGRPVVVDFGVARAAELGGERVTRTGELVGTLAYASPEQLRGDDDDVDTRSDVWGLGALLVTLLTGEPPYDLTGLSAARAAERLEGARPLDLSGHVSGALSSDLQAVVRTALAPEPDARYSSAAALADDVRRVLAGDPIAARPPRTWRIVTRLARRHRVASAAAIAALLALLLGAAVATWQALRARRAEAEAKVDAARHEAVSGFLVGLLRATDPLSGMPAGTTVLELLERAERELADDPPLDPSTEAELRLAVGRALRSFGAFERAAPHLERALALAGGSAFAGDAQSELAALSYDSGDFAGASRWFEAALASWEAGGAAPGTIADGWTHLGAARIELGEPEAAADAFERARGVRARSGLAESGATDVFEARLHHARGELVDARACAERALHSLAERGADDDYLAAIAHEVLANVAAVDGDRVGAEAHARRTIELTELRFGPDSPKLATEQIDLAHFLREAGRSAEALALAERALSIERTQRALYAVVRAAADEGREDRALECAQEAWSLARSSPTKSGANAVLFLARRSKDSDPERAERACRFLVEALPTGVDPTSVVRAGHLLGGLLEAQGDKDGAVRAYRATLAVPEARALDVGAHDQSRFSLARLLRHDEPDEAETLLGALLDDGTEPFSEAIARSDLGWIRLARGDAEAARALFARARDGFESIDGVHPGVVASARRNLATALVELDRLDEARPHFEAAAAVLGPGLGAQGPNAERILDASRRAAE